MAETNENVLAWYEERIRALKDALFYALVDRARYHDALVNVQNTTRAADAREIADRALSQNLYEEE